MINKIVNSIKKYRFEFRHLTLLFILLIIFQIILSIVQKSSLHSFIEETREWYQKDSAEKIANLTAISLEFLFENIDLNTIENNGKKQHLVQSFNVILSQQLMQKNVEEVCIILAKPDIPVLIDEGRELYNYLTKSNEFSIVSDYEHSKILELYKTIADEIEKEEKIITQLIDENTYHIFVPFVPNGEYEGVLYMRKSQDFTDITNEIRSSYNEVVIIYSSLIILGLLAMYYISTYTVKERDEVQKLLFQESQQHLEEKIKHQKESLFTKRIYHTHHKAEKIMGFIKEDLRQMSKDNIEETRRRVTKYSNFISRVIYDMKWYDPPLQTIRNAVFHTDMNGVICFLIDNIFLRISSATNVYKFTLELDQHLPKININEFVVWEILEPLIQNSVDHSGNNNVEIKIKTIYKQEYSQVIISDNGHGIKEEMLKKNDEGIAVIFSENVSSSNQKNNNRGYGCYIAYQMAVKRCGWKMDVLNLPEGGSSFIITIQH